MPAVIKVTGLTKQFKDLTAVNKLSFTVEEGDVYGFLGQNGAGKSTTIRMLMTLIEPTEGEIEIFGQNLRQHRRDILQKIGAVIEKPDLYKYLTAYENLRLFARLGGNKAGRKELMQQLERVGLAQRADSKIGTFSQGMKQRLGIAVALVHDPRLVILDEPVNGLDPQGIADMRQLIISLAADHKKTVFISSHLLHEMEMIATRMLIIHKGAKVVEGTVQELIHPDKIQVELITGEKNTALHQIKQSRWSPFLKERPSEHIYFEIGRNDVPALNQYLVNAGIAVHSLRPRHSLEDYFLQLTGG
jgi:ABC-2 type transport system ATP-binding protein